MDYATDYDVGDRKRNGGINEDSVAVTVFEQGHRDGPPTPEGDGPEAADPTAGADEGSDGDRSDARNRSGAVVALADGAGGHDAGDVASYLATTVICEELADVAVRASQSDPAAFDVDVPDGLLPEDPDDATMQAAVEDAIVAAHREILRYTESTGAVAHTTVVAGIWHADKFHYGWVGDSRAYLVNGATERIERLTKDHSVVEELHESGSIDDVEAHVHPRSNEITRAIGGAAEADPDAATVPVETRSVPVFAEDVLLVTSDGLLDAQSDAGALYQRYVDSGHDDGVGEDVREAVVTDDELREFVLRGDDLDGVAAEMIDMANDRGGVDNLSIVLARDPVLDPTPEEPTSRDIDADVTDRETVIIPDES